MHEVSLSSREKGTKSYIVTTMYIANSSRAFVIQDENLTQCDMTSLSKNKRLLLDEIVSTIHKVFFFWNKKTQKYIYQALWAGLKNIFGLLVLPHSKCCLKHVSDDYL